MGRFNGRNSKMTNYMKGYKKADGRGMRNGTGCNTTHATTIHLSRILLFLRINKNDKFNKTAILKNCCMNGRNCDSALKFLLKEKFIKKSRRVYTNKSRGTNIVYGIK